MALEPVDIDIRMRQNVTEESEKASRSFGDLTKDISSGGESIEKTLTRLGFGFASGAALTAFGNQVIKVRGEMQMLETSFDVLLGGKGVPAFTAALKEFAVESPLSLSGVSDAAQTLLGFGVAAEKVIPTIKQIGDISMGNEERFKSLSLAFAQMYATGKLMGQDLLQMINAGFNPLQTISEKTGKSVGELKKNMEAGAISSEMVAQAFADATAEGGKFYNMTKRQAEGIKGLEAELTGAIEDAYNELGQRNETLITDGYKMATSLVKNYETIGRAVGALVMTYGAYKAAVIVTNVVLKEQAAVNAMVAASNGVFNKNLAYQWVWTGRVQKAQALLNKTMLTNPYVLGATVIMGLVAAAWALSDSLTADERALKKLSGELEAAAEKKELLKGKANSLISVLNKETTTIYQQTKAWKELQSTIPEVFRDMTLDEFKKLTPSDVEMRVNMVMDSRELEEAKAQIIKADEAAEKIRKNLEIAMQSPNAGTGILMLSKQLEDAEAYARQTREHLAEMNRIRAEADFNAKPEAERLAYYEKELETLKKEQAQLESILMHSESINGEWSKFDFHTIMNVSNLEAVNQKMADIEGRIAALTGSGVSAPSVQNKSYWQKQAEEAEKALNMMDAAEKGTEKWNKQLAVLNEAQGKLKVYNFSEKVSKEAQRQADAKKQIENEEKRLAIQHRQSQVENEQELLSLQKDSFRKRLEQIKLEYEAERIAIEKYEQELVEAAQARERKKWERDGSKGTFTNKIKDASSLSEEDIKSIEAKKKISDERLKANTDAVYNELVNRYKDYADQRVAIEKKYNDDIAALAAARDKAETDAEKERISKSMATATTERAKELMSFDFERLKETPEYVHAFEDLKNTSSETLEALLTQLNEMKGKAAEVLSPDALREYTSTIQDILNELVERKPFDALAAAQKRLADANEKLRQAKTKLDAVMSGKDKTMTLVDVNKEYREALDEVTAASNDVEKAQKNIREQTIELYGAISGLGQAIGGTTGEIIGLISDVGLFVDTTIDGIQLTQKAGMEAVSSIEKASIILGIITAAIRLMQSLSSLIPDSHDQYLDFAEKINEINKMRDAVAEYELAVLKARQAEQSWFAKDNLQSLKQAKDINSQILKDYEERVKEQQAIYQNESGGGWLTTLWKPITWLVDQTYGKLYGFDINKDYEEGTTAAINNLRIETRKKSKGVLGSGIGAKSQKTEDLLTWVKNNPDLTKYGDLFDEKGMINETLANVILEKYGDKLVGQTKETIEALVELKEQYNEYIEQLHEYVSSMYEPLVGNFVSAMWDWFDEGKNALDSFEKYASGTFRDIVSDMLRTIILQKVVGTFGDDINAFYEQYAAGKIDEAQLSQLVADRTGVLTDSFEQQLPVLQEMMTVITDIFKNAGFDLNEQASSMTFDSLRSSIRDAFSDGRFDIQDAADFTKNAFKSAMLDALQAKVLNKALEPFLESFNKDAQDGTLFDKMEYYENWIAKIGEEGNAFMEAFTSLPGMEDLFKTERQGASKGIESISQDSANAIEGTMYALRISFNDFFNMYKEEADMRSAYIELLGQVVENTGSCSTELAKMNKTLNSISNEGVIIKKR